MVILRKDYETKEIEIPGFRKILNDPKHPNNKEVKMYMKQGWIVIDTEDDAKELEKAKQRKKTIKKTKENKPKYDVMKENIEKLIDNNKLSKEVLTTFLKRREDKIKYNENLKWYNDLKIAEKIKELEEEKKQKETKATSQKEESKKKE